MTKLEEAAQRLVDAVGKNDPMTIIDCAGEVKKLLPRGGTSINIFAELQAVKVKMPDSWEIMTPSNRVTYLTVRVKELLKDNLDLLKIEDWNEEE